MLALVLVALWSASAVLETLDDVDASLPVVDVVPLPLLSELLVLWFESDEESPPVCADAIAPFMLPITSAADSKQAPALR
ncbi:hypothetical protein [Mycobacterium sp. NPDC050441]|uniref:hypothetical protein n=1 Tax=Mycobacterium sp. NPDC050441 TaxID=3155403 RepID=UPI0034067F68